MSGQAKNARAGWYPDSQIPGGERYWDGERWTDQRRSGAGRLPSTEPRTRATSATPIPVAGWYDDPSMVNTRRYWDGSKWTDHRQEKPAQAPQPPSQDASNRSFFARPLTLGGVVLIAVLAWVVFRTLDNASAPSVDSDMLEIELTAELADEGYEDVDIRCAPVGSATKQGDETVCDGTTKDGEVSVLITFNSDGSYIWQVQ